MFSKVKTGKVDWKWTGSQMEVEWKWSGSGVFIWKNKSGFIGNFGSATSMLIIVRLYMMGGTNGTPSFASADNPAAAQIVRQSLQLTMICSDNSARELFASQICLRHKKTIPDGNQLTMIWDSIIQQSCVDFQMN